MALSALVVAPLLAAAAGCTRTASPAPVPAALEPWPTTLESVRRDAGATHSAPLRPTEDWRIDFGRGLRTPLAIRSGLLLATSVDRRVAVIRASDGDFFWERRLRGVAAGGAVFDRTRVLVGSVEDDSYAQAFELERGFNSWSAETPPPVGAALLEQGRSYWSTESGVLALEHGDGTLLWHARLPGAAVHTPIPHRVGLLVSTTADTLYRLEPSTGRVLDRLLLPATVSATPARVDDRLILPLHDTTVVTVDLDKWRVGTPLRTGGVVRAAPVVDRDGIAYLLTDQSTVWRLAPDGAAVLADPGGAARASLALAANGLLVGRLDGMLLLIDFEGNELWRHDMDDSIEAPALAHEGAVYVPLLRGEIVRLVQDD